MKWRLPHRQLRYGRVLRRSLQYQASAGGTAKHHGRSASYLNEGSQVLDLALDGVGLGVPAVAPSATVVIEHSEPLPRRIRPGVRCTLCGVEVATLPTFTGPRCPASISPDSGTSGSLRKSSGPSVSQTMLRQAS
jgi:hypothetical protein